MKNTEELNKDKKLPIGFKPGNDKNKTSDKKESKEQFDKGKKKEEKNYKTGGKTSMKEDSKKEKSFSEQ
jgi:hypothetical protein